MKIVSDGILAYCSLLKALFSGVYIRWYRRASNEGGLRKTSYFRAKCVNILKTVDPKLLMIDRKLHMRFRLTSRLLTFVDIELL